MGVHKLTAGDGYTYLTRQVAAFDTSQPAEYATHRGLMETEAESVAYVLAGLLGLDTTDYSIGYITSWTDGDTEIIKTTATNVLHAVHDMVPVLTQKLTLVPATAVDHQPQGRAADLVPPRRPDDERLHASVARTGPRR